MAQTAARQIGRPKASVRSGAVMTWVTEPEHDRLIQIARDAGCSVSSVVREAIRLSLLEKSRHEEKSAY